MADVIQQFLAGSEDIKAPFELHVEGQHYLCTDILRFLPGRRLVVKAEHNNLSLLLKLFVPSKKGWRELSREQHGYRACIAADVAVPKELFLSDNFAGCLAVAYQFLEEARSFSLQDVTDEQAREALLDLMLKCHNAGIYQHDIHTDNVLMTPQGLFLIDLASIQGQIGKPLPASKSLKNLARLLVQFKPDEQQHLLERLEYYYRGRGWRLDNDTQLHFMNLLDKAWQKRKDNYLSKRFRSCTMTVYEKNNRREFAFRRSFYQLAASGFVENIEQLVNEGEVLKAGNSATVVKTWLGGRQVVIKRYNIKSPWHFVKRCWRRSRAANAWQHGNLMELLGIATPKVLGFVEQRLGPLRTRAYLICEISEHAQELSKVYADRAPSETELRQVGRIFRLLAQYRISHGDLKASNLLLTAHGEIELIDLDAMQEHRHHWFFQKAFARDQRRFMKNWQSSGTKDKFKAMLS